MENSIVLKNLKKIIAISNDSSYSIEKKLQNVLKEITICLNLEKCSVMMPLGKNKLIVAASTDKKLIGEKQLISSNSPSSWVFKNKKPFYHDGSHKSGKPATNRDSYKKESFMLVPILNGRKVIAILSVTDKIGDDLFSRDEQELLIDIASIVINALENHRIAKALKQKKAELSRKNKTLKKLEQLKTDLFNMLIHDLKGPVSEVVANLDILSYTSQGENLEYVQSAQSGCDTLFRMISDLLDITRLEDGTIPLIIEPINPNSLVKDALNGLHGLLKIKTIESVLTLIPDTIKSPVRGDRRLLMRVLQNFIVNAISYSDYGGNIEIGCKTTHSDSIEFFVKDYGPGISEEFQQKIFDKFYQLDDSYGRKNSTGLGLTFCKLAIDAHTGKVYVESDGKSGSCFKFNLPC